MKKLEFMHSNIEKTTDEIFDEAHNIFKETLAKNGQKPKLGEKEIQVPLKWIEYKAELFWHIASIENKSGINILPCVNEASSSRCESNCVKFTDIITLSNGDTRAKCLYRALKIPLIRSIIDLYNLGDSRVKYWEKKHTSGKNRIYLRYQEEEIDYIIVFEEKNANKVLLITAYPIFYISAKEDYEKDYNKYKKSR